MIVGFADKATEKLFNGEPVRSFPSEIHNRAYNKLHQIDFAGHLKDLSTPPSNRLEQLSGTLSGYWSIRINAQWRIVFRWKAGNADDVKICDYH